MLIRLHFLQFYVQEAMKITLNFTNTQSSFSFWGYPIYLPMNGICFNAIEIMAEQMKATVDERSISVGVVQMPNIPSYPLPRRFLMNPDTGTSTSRCIR